MAKIKLPLKQARSLTDKIIAALKPGCERIEAAGSIRRCRPEVGDIEIVAIARPDPPRPELGTKASTEPFGAEPVRPEPLDGARDALGTKAQDEALRTNLDNAIENLVLDKRLIRGDKNGKKFKNFLVPAVPGLGLDLFIPTRETWGVIFTIRTGPAEFSQKLVTQQNKGGFLPGDLHVKEGRVWRGEVALPTKEEADVFKLLGWYIEPERRTADFRPSRHRLVLMNRIGQGHLEPGMSLEKMKGILRDADIASLDSASDEELKGVWAMVVAAQYIPRLP